MKPTIGVVPLFDRARDSLWMLPGYFDLLQAAGALPVMLPLDASAEDCAQLLDQTDGLLLTGGQDVDPALYGEPKLDVCGECCPALDQLGLRLLELALDRDLPVLGICRGAQLLNAALGGTLYQDLSLRAGTEPVRHRMDRPYDQPWHAVELPEDTPLRRLLGRERLMVNSCHHQGVKDLAPELRPMALAPDGLIEGVWHPGRRFVWAVQWHPEMNFRREASSLTLARAFVSACGG